MRTIVVVMLLALAACGEDPQAKRAADAADVAAVKAVQNRMPPLAPIQPEPLLAADVARIDATGPGCVVRLGEGLAPPVLVAVGSFGWVKLDGMMLKVAGDSGSDRGPSDTWTRYSSKEATLRVEYPGATAVPTGKAGASSPVTLTMRDAWDRVVYRGEGIQTCSS